MLCKYCGAVIPDDSRFCTHCGNPADDRTPAGGFDRKAFKERAKRTLSGKYWLAFVVCLIAAIVNGGLRLGFSVNRMDFNRYQGVHPMFWPFAMTLGIIAGFALFVLFVAGVCFSFFLAMPVTVGEKKFFVENSRGKCELGLIMHAFKADHYFKVVKAMAWRLLFTFLWALLFIVPGIVKSYAYCLVPYILTDNPNIGYQRALKLSMEMTRGYKGRIFVLQLSFIGWYLLGLLCFGVGVLFVNPYLAASMAEMYAVLREQALASGICTAQELG